MLELVAALLLLSGRASFGVATVYTAERFAGRPLFCDNFDGKSHVYDARAAPWAAVDVGLYRSGAVSCGDELLILFEGGRRLRVRALDAGTFEGYWVKDWPELPIVVDLPEHLMGVGSARVMWWNLTGFFDSAGLAQNDGR